MRVLHFIPHFNDVAMSVGLQYKLNLIKVMAESADVHILCADHPDIDMGNVHFHKFSLLRNMFGGRHSSFDRFLSEIRPDIVHIHSCWNIYAYYFQKRCEKFRIPTVITVDRQLEVWHVSYHYWSNVFFKVFVYQNYLISHAKAVHSVCHDEVKSISGFIGYPRILCSLFGLRCKDVGEHHMEALGVDKSVLGYDIYITKHNETFRYVFNIDVLAKVKTISVQIMSDEMLSMYRVVLDSNPFMLMSLDECRAEDVLLFTGVNGNNKGFKMSAEDENLLKSLSSESWRKILLHSLDEGILDYVFDGVEKYELSLPLSREVLYDVYRLPSEEKQLVENNKRIYKLKSDTDLSDVERSICIMIVTILYGVKHFKRIRRSDVVELYCCLKYNKYDEILLYNKVQELGLRKDTARLFQIMKERYGLSEGFMFIEPVADNGTMKLKNMFFKANIQ